MEKVYISGKISGNDKYIEEFQKAEDDVRSVLHFDVVNPAKAPKQETWLDYMRHDIKLLMDCDYIYMLKNWESSKGAKIEHDLAVKLGIQIFYEDNQ